MDVAQGDLTRTTEITEYVFYNKTWEAGFAHLPRVLVGQTLLMRRQMLRLEVRKRTLLDPGADQRQVRVGRIRCQLARG